ncbi:FAD dependent oxidoreductase [Caballeronia udeis]|uniref:FAD dependent oxidoreductase n=1 Tax=Caballeronia udeis TaxID=1232866 RepID=A0A158FNF3_9BURK|nr:FAD dependent oxidoreductase [Caballeronia udeis]
MKLKSWWLDSVTHFGGALEEPVDGVADVVVIGPGFTGLPAALALGKRGASVTVLEASTVGSGVSGRNTGHCNTGAAQDYAAVRSIQGV